MGAAIRHVVEDHLRDLDPDRPVLYECLDGSISARQAKKLLSKWSIQSKANWFCLPITQVWL